MSETDLGVFHLAGAGFTAQLAHDFYHLSGSGRADRMALSQQSAGRVHDDLAAEGRGTALDETSGGAVLAETESFVIEQLRDAEGVMYLRNVNVPRPDPGFF